MICKKFQDLSVKEKVVYIGELTHACMNDDTLFLQGNQIIESAKKLGLFENVKIMPSSEEKINDDTQD